jgi:hypothetical protein
MTELGDVFDSLKGMGLVQLLLAFLACIGYTLAQGGLLAPRGRGVALSTALVAVGGFVVSSGAWMHSAVLVAFALSALGVFTATAWLCGKLLGLMPETAPVTEDPATHEHDVAGASGTARPSAGRRAMGQA